MLRITALALVGCGSGIPEDKSQSPLSPPAPQVPWPGVHGPVVGGGFGSALVYAGEQLVVAEPISGTVYVLGDDGPTVLQRGGALFGAALGLDEDGVVIGDPVVGQVVDAQGHSRLVGGQGTGRVLSRHGPLAAVTSEGWWSAGLGHVPTAASVAQITRSAAGVWTSFRSPDLILEGPSLLVRRDDGPPDLGLSFAIADIDGDGVDELILGAPGTGLVEVRSSVGGRLLHRLQPGLSGFGTALAVGDIDGDGLFEMLVGSPGCGDARQGCADLYRGTPDGPEPWLRWTGQEPEGGLGSAVAIRRGELAIGAPHGVGRVVRLTVAASSP